MVSLSEAGIEQETFVEVGSDQVLCTWSWGLLQVLIVVVERMASQDEGMVGRMACQDEDGSYHDWSLVAYQELTFDLVYHGDLPLDLLIDLDFAAVAVVAAACWRRDPDL